MTSTYRVVCAVSQEKNKIYTAVHKAEKGLHLNMFLSLQMEHPEVKDMRRIGGSMYLDDLPSGPKFTITPDELAASEIDLKALLTDDVIHTFNKMKADGRDSSLRFYLTDLEHYAKIEPNSAVAARVSQQAKDEIARKRRLEEQNAREQRLGSYAPAWQRFQSRYSGD